MPIKQQSTQIKAILILDAIITGGKDGCKKDVTFLVVLPIIHMVIKDDSTCEIKISEINIDYNLQYFLF